VVNDEPDVKTEVAAIEAICKSNLRNPHIVCVYDILFRNDLWGRQTLIQMEFCDGTLDSYLDEIRSLNSAIQPLELAEIMIQILTGLSHCHTLGFCHRDLKLANSTQFPRCR
jgi:serine/threonine protein kinase